MRPRRAAAPSCAGLKKRRENAGRSILFAAFVDGRSSCLSRCLQVLVGLPAERHPLALIVVVSPIVSLTLFAFEVGTGVCAEPVEEVVLGGELRLKKLNLLVPVVERYPVTLLVLVAPVLLLRLTRLAGGVGVRAAALPRGAGGAGGGGGWNARLPPTCILPICALREAPPGTKARAPACMLPAGVGCGIGAGTPKVPDLGAGAEGRFWACSCTDRAGEGRRRRGRV